MKKRGYLLTMLMSLILSTAAFSAQQAGGPPGSTVSEPSDEENDQAAKSDSGATLEGTAPRVEPMTPLSGAEEFRLGQEGGAVSYLQPAFQWTGFADTNATSAPGVSHLETRNLYVGSLTLKRMRGHSGSNLEYAGGAFFYSHRLRERALTPPPSYGAIHSLNLMQDLSWRRWKLLLGDQLLYLPESAFGFSGLSGLESFGSGLGGGYLGNQSSFNPTLLPGQAILTGNGRRLSNAAVTQVQFNPGARSAITATATYGLLHFFEPGFINHKYVAFLSGYNYQLTRRDQLSIYYTHNFFKFDVANRQILNRGFQLAYGHQLTGRLSVELAAGPALNQIAQPFGGRVTRFFWTTYDSLQYRSGRNNLNLYFLRFLTGGSGALFGAETNLARLRIGRQLGRRFSGSLEAGHAFNKSLIRESGLSRRTEFEVWEGGPNLSRELRRNMSIYLNYRVQRQVSNTNFCFGNRCGTSFLRQVGGIGLNWHGRPLRVD